MTFKANGILDLEKKIKALNLVFGQVKIQVSGYVLAKNILTKDEDYINFHNDQLNDGIGKSITIDRCDLIWATWETKEVEKLSFKVSLTL